jgi:hypothetical protein
MSSFVRFVLSSKKEASPLGDVARDIKEDKAVKRTWCYKSFVKYLDSRGASENVYDIIKEANDAYTRTKQL